MTLRDFVQAVISKLEWPFKRVGLAWEHVSGASSLYHWPVADIFVLFLALVAALILLGLLLRGFSVNSKSYRKVR